MCVCMYVWYVCMCVCVVAFALKPWVGGRLTEGSRRHLQVTGSQLLVERPSIRCAASGQALLLLQSIHAVWPLRVAKRINTHCCHALWRILQVSLKGMFAAGQAYVALSRARSLEGLQIIDHDSNCIKVCADVYLAPFDPFTPGRHYTACCLSLACILQACCTIERSCRCPDHRLPACTCQPTCAMAHGIAPKPSDTTPCHA